eukprot:Clim_evm15s214 gene=Clim_evmTU15s214
MTGDGPSVATLGPGSAPDWKTTVNLLIEFLECAIHNIIYQRAVYDEHVFKRVKKYGVPVVMARHPELISYVQSILTSLKPWIEAKAVETVVCAVTDDQLRPIEKWVFDTVALLPVPGDRTGAESTELGMPRSIASIEQGFRDFFLRIAASSAALPLPQRNTRFAVLAYTRCDDPSNPPQPLGFSDRFSWVEAEDREHRLQAPMITGADDTSVTNTSAIAPPPPAQPPSSSSATAADPTHSRVVRPMKSFDTGLMRISLAVEYTYNHQDDENGAKMHPLRDRQHGDQPRADDT